MTVTAESLFVPTAPSDRRTSQRYKPAQPVATIIGRGKGSLVDISATGARVRHTCAVARGAHVRVTFDWHGSRFEAAGKVLASRVAGITRDGTLFESRIHFQPLTEDAAAVLENALEDLGSGDLRRWLANLHGWSDEDAAPAPVAAPASAFIRCRFVNGRWEQRLSRDPAPPVDGFVVAGGTDPSEIRALCRTFETSDAEGRRLLQVVTSAVANGESK